MTTAVLDTSLDVDVLGGEAVVPERVIVSAGDKVFPV